MPSNKPWADDISDVLDILSGQIVQGVGLNEEECLALLDVAYQALVYRTEDADGELPTDADDLDAALASLVDLPERAI